jgi:hypothetical protein
MWKLGQKAVKNIGKATVISKDWIKTNPGKTTGFVSCVAAAPLTITLGVPAALGHMGFLATGVGTGK